MASTRQIHVGPVPIGGGAPVAVQTMTKTETANVTATMEQIGKVAEAGADIVRVAVPREQDALALKEIVARSPIPVIADIHFNHTLALKALQAGAHCVRINPGNIGGPEKVAEVVAEATRVGTPLRVGVNSGSLPKHLRELEFENPVEALVRAAVETVELMERLQFTNFKVSMKSTSVPNTIASNRLLAGRIPYPLHIGITEAGTKWSGSLKSAVGLGTLLADGIGDTVRISLSTFHAEEEVKVAWEILKALKLRERGPVLIACPTCGRLQFDMDTVVAEVQERLEAYDDPIEVSVLGCAVNGIGEARHADFGITGAKDMGMIYSRGEPLRKVPTERLVDELFAEIDRYYAAGKRVQRDEAQAAEARQWLAANEDDSALTPERMAALEAAAAEAGEASRARLDEHDAEAGAVLASMREANGGQAAERANGDADASGRPALASAGTTGDGAARRVAGRRFTRR
jgi:(E)-4-hydroxy-3-methylbut-2-enyl-diphosphate synthase